MKLFMPCRLIAYAVLMTFFMGFGMAQSDEGSVAVQLNPLAITAISANGYTGRTIVTPYFRVTDEKALARLCGRLPRLTEVVLIAFNETPAELARLNMHIAERQDEFKSRIESVIGVGVFSGFYAIVGARKRGEGTALAEVKGGTQTCQPIKQFPWEVEGNKKPDQIKPIQETVAESDTIRRSPLSERELAAAEAELLVEQPPQGAFPGEPKLPSSKSPPWVLYSVFIFALGGVMLIAGSYIGYQVAKIRRERRRQDRRQLRKERRAQTDRRQQQLEISDGGDKRKVDERRKVNDRRQGSRRDARDRRDKE